MLLGRRKQFGEQPSVKSMFELHELVMPAIINTYYRDRTSDKYYVSGRRKQFRSASHCND
jgi:hypothetical protein